MTRSGAKDATREVFGRWTFGRTDNCRQYMIMLGHGGQTRLHWFLGRGRRKQSPTSSIIRVRGESPVHWCSAGEREDVARDAFVASGSKHAESVSKRAAHVVLRCGSPLLSEKWTKGSRSFGCDEMLYTFEKQQKRQVRDENVERREKHM